MKAKVIQWFQGFSNKRDFIGYCDVEVEGICRYCKLEVLKSTANKWGFVVLPPYVTLRDRRVPAYSLIGEVNLSILRAIDFELKNSSPANGK